MRGKRMRKTILAAMVLTAVIMTATDVAAGVRVGAVVRTPNISLRIGNVPAGRRIAARRLRPMPVRRRIYRIVKHDIRIARRLAWYSGVHARELLRHRRQGYTWFEIGRWYYMPRRIVRAAMSPGRWNRLLHAEGYVAWHEGGRGRDHGRGEFRGRGNGR